MIKLLNRLFTKKTKKVLCLFDYKSYTGFATVSTNIKKELKAHFGQDLHLDIVAINYFGEPIEEEDGTYVISAVKSAPKKDDFGRFGFLKILKDSNEYDGIFIIQDLGVITKMIQVLEGIKAEKKRNKKKVFKSIFYFPIDCTIIPSVIEGIDFFDTLVTYTEYGRNEVLKIKPQLKGKVKVIPHGNNGKNFFPLPSDEILRFRNEYFGDNAHKFIFTNVNRNQPRKDIPTTIFAFVEASKRWKKEGLKNEPFLYLHMDGKDPMGWDLRALLMQTHLKEGIDYMIFDTQKYVQGASIDMLNKIFNACDVYVTTTLGEGWGLCLHPSSEVLTSNGSKQIKDVKIGDEVMTNSGKFEQVLDTTCRKVDSYVEVKTKYGYKVQATHEHPYYSLVNGKEAYRKINDLKEGDYLAIVKQNKVPPIKTKCIDLVDYFPENQSWNVDDVHISNKYGYSPNSNKWSISTICKEYNTTKKVVENAILYIMGKKDKVSESTLVLANNLIANGFDKPKPLKINRFVELNKDVLWVFGWYLAEGSCEGGKRLEFSMCRDEIGYAKKIAKIISDNFGIKDISIRVFENKCAVRVSSVALASIFKELFGNGAYNKRIPEILFKNQKTLMPLVDGYIKGDGHTNLKNDTISFSTISSSLAYQMQSILASNDIMISIRLSKKRGLGNYDMYHCTIPCHHLRRYMDSVGIEDVLNRESKRNHKPDFIETYSHFFVPIISIKEVFEKDAEMYDLCVENSHSFVANGLVCHNTVTEAMATKTPIICPISTSFIEMTDNGNRVYGLDTLLPFANTTDNVIRSQCDFNEVADNMIHIAQGLSGMLDDIGFMENYNERIEKSYNWVKTLEWKEVCKQWIKYFKETY